MTGRGAGRRFLLCGTDSVRRRPGTASSSASAPQPSRRARSILILRCSVLHRLFLSLFLLWFVKALGPRGSCLFLGLRACAFAPGPYGGAVLFPRLLWRGAGQGKVVFVVWRLSCPRCASSDLWVVAGSFAGRMRLCADGFTFTDAAWLATEDEQVECGACGAVFPLPTCRSPRETRGRSRDARLRPGSRPVVRGPGFSASGGAFLEGGGFSLDLPWLLVVLRDGRVDAVLAFPDEASARRRFAELWAGAARPAVQEGPDFFVGSDGCEVRLFAPADIEVPELEGAVVLRLPPGKARGLLRALGCLAAELADGRCWSVDPGDRAADEEMADAVGYVLAGLDAVVSVSAEELN